MPSFLRASLGLSLVLSAASACLRARDPSPGRIQAAAYSPCPAARSESSGFDRQLLRLDLDGDGAEEQVEARLTGIEPEPGHSIWTVAVLPAGPSWTVHDYGEGSWVRRPGEPGCLALATEWVPEISRRGADRWLFVGRLFRLARGRLEPVLDQPVLVRCNLEDFERERAAASGGTALPCVPPRGAPLRWLQARSSEERKDDPFLRRRVTFRLVARVLEVSDPPLEVQVQVTGFLARLRPDPAPAEDTGNEFARFGDARSGRLYPPDYRPADPASWLVGRRVALSTYPQDREMPRRILWVGL
jgi:hypothetical protein